MVFLFLPVKRRLVDEIDRINRKIVVLSRGVLAPLLDGSLVPFCSNIIVACMRANIGLRVWQLVLNCLADYLTVDGPAKVSGWSVAF